MSFHCDPQTLERLEWPRLAECLAGGASTLRGAEACRGELFAPTRAAVLERLAETDEARALLDADEDLPLGGIRDLRDTLAALARGVGLPATDFAAVLVTLRAAARVRAFLTERAERAPALAALGETLPPLESLVAELESVVTEEGELRDDASPELRRARRRVRELEVQIERQMATYLSSADVRPHLQDHYVTFRESRPVLPVRAEARSRVRGIVHAVSSSGTTVFIEPEGVVEIGNQLRLAQTELEREVERLLRALGVAVDAHGAEIEGLGTTLEALDVAAARARLSRRVGGSAPATAEDAAVDLRQLRHPLLLLEAGLADDEVVPNDVALFDPARALVISGPNAGGKTVIAKALGLAALALRAGLHVPCAEGSALPILDAVYADIGDDQDLRAGLSTFSARMRNLAGILDRVDERALVIIDEVGEGTEPGEGAALAQAILEALVERRARVVATTHFNRLKQLAGSDPRFANASAEFDAETLTPTYRIHMGVPGGSGARWVAQRMGLAAAVVERAQQLLDHEDRKLEALTASLERTRQEFEEERRRAAREREESETLRSDYESRLESLTREREKALAAMKAELESAYTSARAEIADVVRRLQRGEGGAGRAANEAQRALREIRERTAAVEQRHADAVEPAAPVALEHLVAGARLEVDGLPAEATVEEPPDRRGRVAVRVGGVRTSVPVERVVRVIGGPPAARSRPTPRYAVESSSGGEAASRECDLRGLRVDEALDRAEAYLHGIVGRGEPSVILIHGHGSGALRNAIRVWLREQPGVADFAPGGPGEGGNGVTVVRLTH